MSSKYARGHLGFKILPGVLEQKACLFLQGERGADEGMEGRRGKLCFLALHPLLFCKV